MTMTEAAAQQVYVVRRHPGWELRPHWYGVWDYRAPKRGGVVRAFRSKERAEAFKARLEQRRRQRMPKPRVNPFYLSRYWEMDYGRLTRFPESVLDDWLRDLGLSPPVSPPHMAGQPRSSWVWARWWEQTPMTQEQRAGVWKALDRVEFYEVVTLELE
jgi:hypothetical protein